MRFCDDLVEPDEGAAADEENLLGVDLDVFLMRMLAAALRRDVAGGAFENFQQRLLHAFAANIAGDGDVVGLAADLVDFVDVNDADLRALHVVIGVLQQPQDDVLHVLADIAGFGQRRGIGDAERHIENLGERLGEQRLAGAGRADQQDIALLDLDIGERIRLKRGRGVGRRRALQDALVMIVHRDGERLLREVLPDDILVERAADLRRLRHANGRGLPARVLVQLLVEDAFADIDAAVADVNAGAGDELAHFRVAFAAEAAHGEIGGACHDRLPVRAVPIPRFSAAKRPPRPRSSGRSALIGAVAVEQFGFLARLDHLVHEPVGLGLGGASCNSRDPSPCLTCSSGLPVCWERMRISRFLSLNMYSTVRSTSLAWPCAPPETW